MTAVAASELQLEPAQTSKLEMAKANETRLTGSSRHHRFVCNSPDVRWRGVNSNFRFRARFGLVFVVSLFVLRFVAEA